MAVGLLWAVRVGVWPLIVMNFVVGTILIAHKLVMGQVILSSLSILALLPLLMLMILHLCMIALHRVSSKSSSATRETCDNVLCFVKCHYVPFSFFYVCFVFY